MLVLRFALKAVRSVHVLRFVVSAVDEHVLRIQPCGGVNIKPPGYQDGPTFVGEGQQDDLN